MISLSVAASLLAYSASVAAHGGVTSMSIGSTTYTGWSPYNPPAGQVTAERPYSSYNPILSATDPTLHCNDDGTAGPSQQDLAINAGQTLTAHWTQWTHLPGPVTVYMAACGGSSCTGVNSGSVSWFKINEVGLINGTVANGNWGDGILLNTLKWDATVPVNLKPGAYFIRYETLALHQSFTPQWYPECIQLIVSGSGSALPPASITLPIPGAYSQSDPGVYIDIYGTAAATQTTYPIPGPTIWSGFDFGSNPAYGSGSGGGGTSGGTTTTTTTTAKPTSTTTTKAGVTTSSPKPTTTTTTSTTTAKTTTTSASGAQQTQYGQCGGTGYSGPTVCASPYTCKVSNSYYSQCL